jgi:predicted dehydrogenase/nucleoside-diphosphate-sugar epimerase
MAQGRLRVGFAGAGYIAGWHAMALARRRDARLVAVCDPALAAARALAGAHGAEAFASLDEMLARARCDVVHILTPPHLHRDHALAALDAGAHVLVEKPFALDSQAAQAMNAAAATADQRLAANHNFLGLPAYRRLKRVLAAGTLGPVDSADIHWRYPLSPLRTGPFGLWVLREPGNLLLELGPHPFAFATDLFGEIEDIDLRLAKPIELPGGAVRHQSWQIRARAGETDLALHLSLVEGHDDRSLILRGVGGTARLDYAADTLVVDRPNTSDIVLNPLRREAALAGQHLRAGLGNAARQIASLNRAAPFALGIAGCFDAFYGAIAAGEAVPAGFSGEDAARVTRAIERTLARMPLAPRPAAPTSASPAPDAPPAALVIGGTGFVGRHLTRALVAAGHRVRVLSRGAFNPFADLGDRVELAPVALDDVAGLRAAMQGVPCVFHLARTVESSWQGYLDNDVAVTERIAEAALDAGVRRFVYTGTIDAYDASRPDRTIDEETGFAPDMGRRNLYARSKALCEDRLSALQRARGLPLVIARPGIVLGEGGPLQHWGLGRWSGAGAVRLWNRGRNILPLVLVEDVADGLVRILQASDAAVTGQSFNLVGAPLMSARDYFDALHQVTGLRIRVAGGAPLAFYLADLGKYLLKRHALRRSDLASPSLADWRARGHLSPYSNARARKVLGWQPEPDKRRFALRALGHGSLFGFAAAGEEQT